MAAAIASAGAIRSVPNTEGAPDLARPPGNSAPLSASPNNAPRLPCTARPHCEIDVDRQWKHKTEEKRPRCDKGKVQNGSDDERSVRKGRPVLRQLATYLLHFVERRLIDAEFLEVILRRLYHTLDDLLVDQALMSLLACCFN